MKYKNILSVLMAFIIMTVFTTSCSDFLDEDLTTQRNSDYFNTPEGIEDLATGMYYNLRFHFSYEWSYATTNYGTDEFTAGGDASNGMWNSYERTFSPLITAVNVNTVLANAVWDNMYIGINSANLLLEKAQAHLPEGTAKDTYMGEAYFIRGFNYLKLASQYGGVPLKTATNSLPEREFPRATAEQTMNQVISDLSEAYRLLPSTAAVTGKITKDATAHFLAKSYLLRASEINDSWNSAYKTEDLTKGLAYADEVISHHQLAPNFADLWNYTTIDGANEKLDEILLAAQFTSNKSTRGTYGNQTHLYYLSQYLNLPQMKRDIAGGREYQRLRTTYYAYNVFNRVEDSRFWKTFKTKYAVNNPAEGSNYKLGDLSIMYIINQPDDTRFAATGSLSNVKDPKTGKVIPSVYATYAEGKEYLKSENFQNRFAPLSKFIDGSREAVADVIGYRDGILARLADTYLTAAEICIRQNNYGKALTYINPVRNRGAYKAGEDRSVYTDGGAAYNPVSNAPGYASFGAVNSFYSQNSYYESNNIPVTTDATDLTITSFATLPAEDEAIISKLGYASEYDRAMCFLLNERSRELMGEFYRWEDLSRTKTLEARVKAFNTIAEPHIKQQHLLRPIPQSFLDAVQNNGKALTAEEKSAMQNPGWF